MWKEGGKGGWRAGGVAIEGWRDGGGKNRRCDVERRKVGE